MNRAKELTEAAGRLSQIGDRLVAVQAETIDPQEARVIGVAIEGVLTARQIVDDVAGWSAR